MWAVRFLLSIKQKLVLIRSIINPWKNKTKYFRLRLFDEVGTERPERDLSLMTDLRLTSD